MEEFADCHTPGDYFLKYYDQKMIDDIIYQSNLYVNQKQRRVPVIMKKEMYGFLGINLVMGYHKLPSWKMYWRNDADLSVPFVGSTMPRNRFSQILSNLHVNDNSAIPKDNKDKLYKLRPLISALNGNYAKLYSVSRYQSIDESMILFKGRSSIKQYNPMKPIKRGYKLWMRADPDGYISKFDIYQGKNSEVNNEEGAFGLGEKVVINMCKELYERNHEVYFDNYFSSIALMEHLKQKKVWACGTIRSNRQNFPENLKADKELARGQFDHRVSNEGLSVYKWKDNKTVHLISNFHGTERVTINRTQKDGSKLEIGCPKAVKDYNKYMGGVDKADMLCAIYGVGRKSKKWWHRIFFGLLDRTVVNAAIAFEKIEKKGLSLLDFRRSVAQTLITLSRSARGRHSATTSPGVVQKRRKNNYSVDDGIRLQNLGCHWVQYPGRGARGRCEVCSKKDIESRPKSKCGTCNVFLCCNEKKNCFAEFHNA